MITDDFMMRQTAEMPMRQIDVGGKPYLQRYFAGTTVDDYDIFIHRFLSADGDDHLHSHPRDSYSFVLAGGYTEEREDSTLIRPGAAWPWPDADFLAKNLGKELCFSNSALHFCCEHLTVFDWHRIARVEPETWSMFIVGPQILPFWYFRDAQGSLESVKSSPRDWWKSCKPRVELAP